MSTAVCKSGRMNLLQHKFQFKVLNQIFKIRVLPEYKHLKTPKYFLLGLYISILIQYINLKS